jgi:hypothetical protein
MTNHISSGEVSAGRTVGSHASAIGGRPTFAAHHSVVERTAPSDPCQLSEEQSLRVRGDCLRAGLREADDAWIDLSSRPRESGNAS